MNEVLRGLAFALVAAASLAVAMWLVPGIAAERPDGRAGGNQCWILVDFDSFFCGSCLEALLGFCRALPPAVQSRRVRAILGFRGPEAEDARMRQARIVEKKWDGFRRANGIRFPAFVDRSRFFESRLKSGTDILLFDTTDRSLRTFSLPLRPGQLEEIRRFLGQ